jgi:hypothetical protein
MDATPVNPLHSSRLVKGGPGDQFVIQISNLHWCLHIPRKCHKKCGVTKGHTIAADFFSRVSFKQCCGSGSALILAGWIRIQELNDPYKKKKVKKIF